MSQGPEELAVNLGEKETDMLTQDDFGAIKALKRQGFKKKAAARTLGLHIKTVKKCWDLEEAPKYLRRQKAPSLLDPFREYLLIRAPQTQYCAAVCLLDIQRQGFTGGYTIVKNFIRPLKEEQKRMAEATIRFETGPGKQAQVDWGSTQILLGGKPCRINFFALVLGYSRRLYVEASLRQDVASLIGCHLNAFEWFGGITHTILYDNPKTICLKRDFEGKDITWNPQFLDFSRYYGFEAHLCKPFRARTKGKIESGIKYVKTNFFGLYGRTFESLEELNRMLRAWCLEIADERIHGTTHEKPRVRFQNEGLALVNGRPPYRIEENNARIVPSDALVVFKTNRYSVPWTYTGKEVTLELGDRNLKIFCGASLLADHPLLQGKHTQSVLPGHLEGILRPKKTGVPDKELLAADLSLWRSRAEHVEVRDLNVYESLVMAGGAL